VEVQQAAGLYADWATYDLYIDSNAESEQVARPSCIPHRTSNVDIAQKQSCVAT
jgi:hypothetical protein